MLTIDLDLPIEQIPLVVLDVESTGLFPGLGDRVVEMGALRVENWQPVGKFDHLVNPGRPIAPRASAVNGIFDADLVGKPPFADVADELVALCDGAIMVAHNANFDAKYVGLELWLAGRDRLENPWLDTLQVARNQFHFGRNSLTHIAGQLNIPISRAHRALNDVYLTAKVLKNMVKELNKVGIRSAGDILHIQSSPIYASFPPAVELPEPLSTALADSADVEIIYMGKKEETTRRITPLYTTVHRGSEYLIAYCHLREGQRSFKLINILGATLL